MKRKEKKDSAGRRTGSRAGGKEWCSNAKPQSPRRLVSSSYSGFINIAVSRGGGAVQAENPACGEEEFSNGCGGRGRARAGENICFELLFHSCADFSIWIARFVMGIWATELSSSYGSLYFCRPEWNPGRGTNSFIVSLTSILAPNGASWHY